MLLRLRVFASSVLRSAWFNHPFVVIPTFCALLCTLKWLEASADLRQHTPQCNLSTSTTIYNVWPCQRESLQVSRTDKETGRTKHSSSVDLIIKPSTSQGCDEGPCKSPKRYLTTRLSQSQSNSSNSSALPYISAICPSVPHSQ